MTEKEFWAGAASGSSRKMLARAQRLFDGAPRPDRIMVNYQTLRSDRDDRWRQYELFIDPGAFSMFGPEPHGQGYEDYPQSTEAYLQEIGRIQPDLYAWRDYVCEESVRDLHEVTVEDQIRRTVEAHAECARLHDEMGISAEPVAVVQGFHPEEYRDCARRLVERDLITDRVGIGTMCGRDDRKTCEEIVAAVRDVLPTVDLHAFGLDRVCYDSEVIMDEITSTDSLAYCFKYKRPAGWSRWEYVFKMFLEHRADWDAALDGADYQSRATAGDRHRQLGVFSG